MLSSGLTTTGGLTIHDTGLVVTSGGLTVMTGSIAVSNGNVDVIGNIDYAGALTHVSDARLKQNILPLTNPLEKLSKLRGVYFSWINDETNGLRFDAERHVGLLAHEVQAVLPEVVKTFHDKYLSVDYSALIPLVIEAINELDAKRSIASTKEEELQFSLVAVQKDLRALNATVTDHHSSITDSNKRVVTAMKAITDLRTKDEDFDKKLREMVVDIDKKVKEQLGSELTAWRSDAEKRLLEEVKKIETREKKLVSENDTLKKKLAAVVSDLEDKSAASEKRILNEMTKNIEKRLLESERKLLQEHKTKSEDMDKKWLDSLSEISLMRAELERVSRSMFS